ncbi:ATPase [Marinilabiliaceae bacterium JC017]|nr:ATPase [Marinilabiliaceae bacterium JC017]
MKQIIAIPLNGTNLEPHFGHAKTFIFLTIENEMIAQKDIKPAPKHEPGVLPKWIAENGATDVIVGGMGQQAVNILKSNGVNVHLGAAALPYEEIVKQFVSNTLETSENSCTH